MEPQEYIALIFGAAPVPMTLAVLYWFETRRRSQATAAQEYIDSTPALISALRAELDSSYKDAHEARNEARALRKENSEQRDEIAMLWEREEAREKEMVVLRDRVSALETMLGAAGA